MDVKDASGKVTNWNLELASPNVLTRNGWKRNSLKEGDAVTVAGSPAKDNSTLAIAQSITLPDGRKLNFPVGVRRGFEMRGRIGAGAVIVIAGFVFGTLAAQSQAPPAAGAKGDAKEKPRREATSGCIRSSLRRRPGLLRSWPTGLRICRGYGWAAAATIATFRAG